MKITIYELLGMVKDGKELPKLENETEKDFAYYVYNKWGDTCNLKDLKKILNEEVEIIEEEKKIPEKIPIGLKQTKNGIFNIIVKDDIHYELNKKEEIICKKIHEIIDYRKSKGE